MQNTVNGLYGGKHHCIADEVDKEYSCQSSDGLQIYVKEDENGNVSYDATCFSCGQWFSYEDLANSSIASEIGIENGKAPPVPNQSLVKKFQPMARSEVVEFIKQIGYVSNGYRGIRDDINKFFGHLTRLDPKTGQVKARYYPETIDSKVSGYKCRNHPKDFSHGKRGVTGLSCELSGQVKFPSGSSKYVLICGGEEDKAAAYQMLKDAADDRAQKQGYGSEDYAPIAVVSPTAGESSAAKQVAAQYDWINGFEIIVVGMDNDDAGRKATEKLLAVLPREKTKVATWSGKDPNKMLETGKHKQFVRDFYAAKDVIASTIIPSTAPMDAMRDMLARPRITLPDFLWRMQNDLNGGIIPGKITNIIGNTSCGKSTLILRFFYHLCMNTPYRPGIVSLEAIADEVKLELIGLHLGINFNAWKDEDVLNYLDQPDVIAQCENLIYDEHGEPRWVVIDERDGDIRTLEKNVEVMCKKHSVDIVFIDVLSDIICIEGLESQRKHMTWQKGFTKSGPSIFNVLHTRKPPVDKDGKVRLTNEYDAIGSSTVVQSGAYNIIIDRDKEAELDIDKNTTLIRASKGRKSKVGIPYKLYYDWKTSKLNDFDDYWADKDQSNVEPNPLADEHTVFDHASLNYDALPTPDGDEYEGVKFE